MDTFLTIIIYIGLACIIAVLVDVGFHIKKRKVRCAVWMLTLFLPSLLAAFRRETGTDSYMYLNVYKNIASIYNFNSYRDFETGYIWLMKILNVCHFSYHMLFFVMELLTVLFFLLFINNEKRYINIKIATFLFMCDLYLSSFNMMRQALAITMVLYAISVFMDKKYIRGILLILLACLFHISALLGFAIVGGKLLFERRYAKLIMTICFAAIIYLICHRELLGEIAYFIIRRSYYAGYFTRDAAGEGSIIMYFIKRSPILIITLLYAICYSKNKRYLVYFGMMFGGYLIAVLGVITATQVQRVGFYFIYMNTVLLACCGNNDLVINKIRIKKQVTQFLIICYAIIVFLYDYVYRGWSDVIPYQGLFKV